MSRRSPASSGSDSWTDRRRPPVYAVILAGGSGTRLWPLARADRPKQFLPLFGGRSLFRLTCDRVTPLVGRGRILVVAGERHLRWIRLQAPEIPLANIVLEGTGRNTAASIGLAALWLRDRSRDAIMAVLPADHEVGPVASFVAALRRAIVAVRRTNGLLTFGVKPRSADAGLGYIRPEPWPVVRGVYRVKTFVEKPPPARARRLIDTGTHFWNSGIFVWRAMTILEELQRHRPDVLRPLAARGAPRSRGPWRIPATTMRRVPATPIDRAVLERSDQVIMMRAPFRWSDLGTWSALWESLPKDRFGNAASGRVMALDAGRCLGVNPAGLTVFLGVNDLVVVRSGDIVLVLPRRLSPQVRGLVERFRRMGLAEHL